MMLIRLTKVNHHFKVGYFPEDEFCDLQVPSGSAVNISRILRLVCASQQCLMPLLIATSGYVVYVVYHLNPFIYIIWWNWIFRDTWYKTWESPRRNVAKRPTGMSGDGRPEKMWLVDSKVQKFHPTCDDHVFESN
jgi:hypothetical protein